MPESSRHQMKDQSQVDQRHDKLRKNISILGRRTCVSLERSLWLCLEDICEQESISLSEVCSMIAERSKDGSLTSSIRVFILAYFRAASGLVATHAPLGHNRYPHNYKIERSERNLQKAIEAIS